MTKGPLCVGNPRPLRQIGSRLNLEWLPVLDMSLPRPIPETELPAHDTFTFSRSAKAHECEKYSV